MDFSKLKGQAEKLAAAARETASAAAASGKAPLADKARALFATARKNLKQATEQGELAPLAEKTRELFEASRESLAALAGAGTSGAPTNRAAELLRDVIARVRAAASQESFVRHRERATELLRSTRDNARDMSDRAATAVAEFYTERTGRQVTPAQVKSVAIKVGAAVVVAVTLSAMMDAGSGEDVALGGGDGGGSGDDGFGNSFEGDMHRFFADKGGLNIETQVVDGDGVILS